MNSILRWAALAFFCQAALIGAASAKPRTALVIGNAKYESSVGALRNTRNDAKAIAKALRSIGFNVIERYDVTRDQLLHAVVDFRKTLPEAEVGLFYYAGHGISVAGSNYLIPLKSGFLPDGLDGVTLRMMAETRLFNVEQAVADMSAAGARCNIVILDACRTTALGKISRDRDAIGKGGLTEMTPPAGSLIAFATDAGQTAFDGNGANGLYTEELLKHMQTPGLTIEQVFKRTRAGVLKRSEGTQLPAEYSRLIGDDIYLAGAAAIAISPAVSPRPAAAPNLPDVNKLADEGDAAACLEALSAIVREKGPGDYSVQPIATLLEGCKKTLKEATGPTTKVESVATTCELILKYLPDCLPPNIPATDQLAAKAHNRRGDALLLLGRTEEAIKEFDLAAPLAPTDAYILYNRGRAYLALGEKEKAREDFTAAANDRFDSINAKKLARQALAELK